MGYQIYREVAPHKYDRWEMFHVYDTKEAADEAIEDFNKAFPGRYVAVEVPEPPKTLVDPEAH